MLIGFRAVYVFDVAQTEGADLPEFEHNITGEVGEQRDRLIAFLAQQNIALEFNERIAPALGVSYGGKIALLPGQSKAEEFTTLVHETAHELLHKAERRTMTTATVRETEAEAVAFIVGQAVGLEMGTLRATTSRCTQGNAALLAESLEVIQRTSAVILAAINGDDGTNANRQRETRPIGGGGVMRTSLALILSGGRRLLEPALPSPHRQPAVDAARTSKTCRISGRNGLPTISVAHYGKQNGDPMRDPEMLLRVAPATGASSYSIRIYWRNDYLGIEQYSQLP